VAAALVAGLACSRTQSVAKSLLFTFVPDRRAQQRRLVMAAWAVAWAGSKPLASLADGVIATFLGAGAATALGGGAARGPGVQAAGVLLALLPGLAVVALWAVPHLAARTRARPAETQPGL
jgi:hypothetical protein